MKEVRIISTEEFDYSWFDKIPIQKRSVGNPGTRSKTVYKDLITAFDIETTRIVEIEQSVMYIWQWAFGSDLCVVGRTWEEFTEFASEISKHLKEHERLFIADHNLSYEYQFLKGIYSFTSDDVFALDTRKVLKCIMHGNLEFRCSYLHTNMSLEEYLDKMGVEHQKLELDYTVRRFPWTPLTDEELSYCVNDVVGLVEAVTVEMKNDNETIYSYPLTQTGYCRRDAKRVFHQVCRYYVTKQLPNMHIYEMCLEAFRGGNTHANRHLAGKILKNVHSVDRSSSYPDVLVNRRFPAGTFIELGEIEEDEFRELYETNKAILMRVAFSNIRLKDPDWGCPYIPRDKCRDIYKAAYDNGRVLTADYLEISLTDIDYRIIEKEYIWDDVYYRDVAYTRYGKIPDKFRDLINEYYHRKTDLKGVPGRELDYLRAKQKLNSLYGMLSMKIIRSIIKIVDNMLVEIPPSDPEAELRKDNRRRVLPPYQFGVWTTAWARYELELAMRQVFKTKNAVFVYTDTDSVKYIGNVSFGGYNRSKIAASRKNGAYATDPQGVTHYMGVLEDEGCYPEFITLGAKKYAYTDEKGKLHITVSGVIKNAGARELEAHGGIAAFKPDFIFKDSGGIEAVYNDHPEISSYEVDGHVLNITSNVVLRPTTYTLGITDEYEQLLAVSGLQNYVDVF